jgi:hypothetical protein
MICLPPRRAFCCASRRVFGAVVPRCCCPVYSLIFSSDLGHHHITLSSPLARSAIALLLADACTLALRACGWMGGVGGAKVANWVKEIGGLEVSLPKAEL